jgi:nicotinamide riboside kinase
VTVTVTGPESTGKTTLSRELACTFGGVWVAEGARRYVEARLAAGVWAPLGPADVEPIARTQIALEDAAAIPAAGRLLVVRDTDLVSTVAYARHSYGACPAWIVEAARSRRAALYLLCDVDLPWTADPGQRDAAGADARTRAALRDRFAATLDELGCAYRWVRGGWDARTRTAADAVRALLAPGAPPPVSH